MPRDKRPHSPLPATGNNSEVFRYSLESFGPDFHRLCEKAPVGSKSPELPRCRELPEELVNVLGHDREALRSHMQESLQQLEERLRELLCQHMGQVLEVIGAHVTSQQRERGADEMQVSPPERCSAGGSSNSVGETCHSSEQRALQGAADPASPAASVTPGAEEARASPWELPAGVAVGSEEVSPQDSPTMPPSVLRGPAMKPKFSKAITGGVSSRSNAAPLSHALGGGVLGDCRADTSSANIGMPRFVQDLQRTSEFIPATGPARYMFDRLSSCLLWWAVLRLPEGRGCVQKFVRSNFFGTLSMAVISLNAAFVTYSANYEVAHLSRRPSQPAFIMIGELVFVALYSLELLAKLWGFGQYFFCRKEIWWNLLDMLLVVASWCETAIRLGGSSSVNLSPVRMLRVLRIIKIFRLFRALRIFSDLRLMLDSLLGSLAALYWSVAMIVFFLFLFSIFFVQVMTDLMIDNPELASQPQGADIVSAFGSIETGMLTLFQATTGGRDWAPVYQTISCADGWQAGVFLFYIVFFVIAIWNIVTSKFIERAMRLAQPELETILMEARSKDMQDTHTLLQWFESMDTDGSKRISKDEFRAAFTEPKLLAFLHHRGMDVGDVDFFYNIIKQAAGEEEFDIDVLVGIILRFKGTATAVDMLTLRHEMRTVTRMQQESFKKLGVRLRAIEKATRGGGAAL